MATKTETISLKVTPEEKEAILQLAEKEDITVSKLLYRILFKKDGVIQKLQKEILD